MQENDGVWLSILEYAQFKKISVSTIRRYIKSERVKTKQIKGKFFIKVLKERYYDNSYSNNRETLKIKLELQELKLKLKILEEENNDLKMLVQLYEQIKPSEEHSQLPHLPEVQ